MYERNGIFVGVDSFKKNETLNFVVFLLKRLSIYIYLLSKGYF